MEKVVTNYLIKHLDEIKEKFYWFNYSILDTPFIYEVTQIFSITIDEIKIILTNIVNLDLCKSSVIFIYILDYSSSVREKIDIVYRKTINWLPDLIPTMEILENETKDGIKSMKYRAIKNYLKKEINGRNN